MVLLKIANSIWFQLKATWKVVYAGTVGLWMTAIAHPSESWNISMLEKKKKNLIPIPYMKFSAQLYVPREGKVVCP